MKKSSFIPLSHPGLPDSIFAGWRKLNLINSDEEELISETRSGKRLISEMIKSHFGASKFNISTKKYEKPEVVCAEFEISASFSHTPQHICGVISKDYIVGVDMEVISRDVNSRLKDRMKHTEEKSSLYNNINTIRIWTMKEAALKAIGTGLRKPMNGVKLVEESEYLFSVNFDDGKHARICSFPHSDQWISICYF